MKKLAFLVLTLCVVISVNAQIIDFPDANFKTILLEASQINGTALDFEDTPMVIDVNNNGEIEIDEAEAVYKLSLSSFNLSDLTGIEYFINLNFLDCSENSISNLDLTSNIFLTHLNCGANNLTNLNISGLNSLTYLSCGENQLTNIDVSNHNNLIDFGCSVNQLTNINVSNLNNLISFDCAANQITNLNLSNNTKLVSLSCGDNLLTNINLSNLINLENLDITNNQLSNIDTSQNLALKVFFCPNNQLTNLNITNNVNLKTVLCENNFISNLDLSYNLLLEGLWCSNNNLVNIDISANFNLYGLECNNNLLVNLFLKNRYVSTTNLNFSNNPNLRYVCIEEYKIVDIQNKLIEYGNTNCQVNSYCSFSPGGSFYTIQGNQKFDSNNNGCDAFDVIVPNLKFSVSNGVPIGSLISNSTGNFSIPVEAGTHTITPKLENSSYFTVSPTTVNITFPTQTSPFTQNFCITANGVRPDLEVTLLPLQPARPGFDAKYKLVYKNKGNTVQSGSVNLNFSDSVLDLVVANPLASSQTTNKLIWNFTALQPFETRDITFTMNANSPMEIPAVINGDILAYTATVTSAAVDETPTDNTFAFDQIVVNSFNPNDKTCLEGTSVSAALIGQYVHYMIRFENTGTFAAENVVVKDMIDLTKFDISTLVPTNASHSYITNISEGNKVEFIFENVNLPFDDANNDGYIAFKIKTKPTLKVNDSFTNEANIYFDYNFPILTNKATSTFIKTLGTQDFDFARYFTLYPNPAKSDLNITAKESIKVNSISVYNTLGQLVLVVTNADKVSKIDVSSLTAGNYFIKINSDKGSSNARFVKE